VVRHIYDGGGGGSGSGSGLHPALAATFS